MGKLLCDQPSSPATIPWLDSKSTPEVDSTDLVSSAAWDEVVGLEEQQRKNLRRLHAKGVLWKHSEVDGEERSVVFRLTHGGEVSSDGNCLFTASRKAMAAMASKERVIDARELRRRTVARFLEDLGSATEKETEMIEVVIRNMYSPDLSSGWGIHVVQEVKLLARKDDRESLDSAIDELVNIGMQRENAAESIYRERCVAVNDGGSWAKYMSISGSEDDEHDIVTLQYTEEGLLSVDENRLGHAAAFGDDIAIECLATEFKREIYVVQAHGSDAMVDEDNCVFFLPHRPRGTQICDIPFFLFMKGTGWCGAGADHYEPLIANPCSFVSSEKVAMVL